MSGYQLSQADLDNLMAFLRANGHTIEPDVTLDEGQALKAQFEQAAEHYRLYTTDYRNLDATRRVIFADNPADPLVPVLTQVLALMAEGWPDVVTPPEALA